MPWIFLCLILANAAYFGWQFVQSGTPRAHVASTEVIPNDKRLVLLSERPDLIARASVQTVAAPEGSEPAAPVEAGPQCYTVGPFASAGSSEHMAERLGRQFKTRVDVLKKDNVDYWVFVPAQVNREKAEAKLHELKQKGVDSFIVNEEPFANAISLGHFSKRDLAEGFRDKMQAASVQAELREVPRKGEERWLYVAPGSSKADIKAVIDGSIAKEQGLRRQPTPCEG